MPESANQGFIGVVEYIGDEVAVMQTARIVEQGASEAVLQHPQHAYTRMPAGGGASLGGSCLTSASPLDTRQSPGASVTALLQTPNGSVIRGPEMGLDAGWRQASPAVILERAQRPASPMNPSISALCRTNVGRPGAAPCRHGRWQVRSFPKNGWHSATVTIV